jgi:hypothetical protein
MSCSEEPLQSFWGMDLLNTVKETRVKQISLSHQLRLDNIKWSSQKGSYSTSCRSVNCVFSKRFVAIILFERLVNRELNAAKWDFSQNYWTKSCVKASNSLLLIDVSDGESNGRIKSYLHLVFDDLERVFESIGCEFPTWCSKHVAKDHLNMNDTSEERGLNWVPATWLCRN